MRYLITYIIVFATLACKPATNSTLSEGPETNLSNAWNTVNALQSKRNSGQALTYSEIVQLMNIVASKYIIQAHERQHLFQLLQEMRIPDISHSARTYVLGKEFGEHPVDRKETVFDIAKNLLIDSVVNTPSSDVKRAFEENISKLPPNAELQAVYSLIPRVLPQTSGIYPPVLFRPKEVTPEEYLGTQRWWAIQPASVQQALSTLDEKSYLKLALTLSGREKESAGKDLDFIYFTGYQVNLQSIDIGKLLSPVASQINAAATKKFGDKNLGGSVFDLFAVVWNSLNDTQKQKVQLVAYESENPVTTMKALLTEGSRQPNIKGFINDWKAIFDINFNEFDQQNPEKSRWSARAHYAVYRAALTKSEHDISAYQEAQTNQAALYYYLNLNIDQNRQAISQRIMQEWKDRNRSAPEEVLGVFSGFVQSGKGIVWDFPKHALYKPIVEGDGSFYSAIGYVATNPDVMASLIINQIDTLDQNQPEKVGGLIFDLGLTVLTIPAGGSGSAGFRVLEKFDDFDLAKARRVTARLEQLAQKASSKLQNSSALSQNLRQKAQQLQDLAGQARTKLKKLEANQAAKSLDELAQTAKAAGDQKLADELASIAKRLRGGEVADTATDLASLRAKYGGKLPGQADELLEEAIQACKVLGLVSTNRFACTIPGPNGTKISPHEDAIVYRGVFAAKDARRKLGKTQFTTHGDKHLKARSNTTAEELAEMTANGQAAQYIYELRAGNKNFGLERTALVNGTKISESSSKTYYLYRSTEVVGYSNGEATRWIRAELASGNVAHGHPRDLATVARDISKDVGDLLRLEIAQKYGSLLTPEEINALRLGPFIKAAAGQ